VNLLIYLADQLLRGCQSADNQFQALQNQATEVYFSLWFPASGARSLSSTNPAFCTDFSPLLAFSGSAEFGTWRIFVPLFWATCRLFSIIPIVLDFRTFLFVNFLYSVYPCPVETSRGSILWLWFSYSVLPFALLRQKGGVC
jgi:hypothetical protein